MFVHSNFPECISSAANIRLRPIIDFDPKPRKTVGSKGQTAKNGLSIAGAHHAAALTLDGEISCSTRLLQMGQAQGQRDVHDRADT